MHGCRIECSYGDRLDVVRLKFLLTAALGTLPSISLKRQEAVGEIDFIVILVRNRLDFGHVQNRVVLNL